MYGFVVCTIIQSANSAQTGKGPEFRHITVQAQFMTYSGVGENKSWDYDTRENIEVEGRTAMSLNIRAGLYVLTHTRILSEYFVPYLISAFPLAYWLWKNTFAC